MKKQKAKVMNRTPKRIILLTFSLVFVMVISVGADGLGVNTGDWAKYGNFSYIWNMPDSVPESPEFAGLNEVVWSKLEVQDIDDMSVTMRSTTHYENGTEDIETITGDAETGSGDLNFLIIEANLNPGTSIPWEFWPGVVLYINGTVSRTYAGASRSVNYIDVTMTEWDATTTIKLYWDKTTGILCEMLMSTSMTYIGTNYSMSVSFKMTETNMWDSVGSMPIILTEWWVWATLAVVIVAICVVAFIARTPARAPPPLPTPPGPSCPTCNQLLVYVPQYQRWYCQNCKKYP